MAKRKKKNAVTLILLLLALAGLIGFYVWYSNKPADEEKTEDTSLVLSTIDTAKVNTLHYSYQDTDLTLVKEDDLWKSEADKNRPINQDRVKSMLDLIDEISATRVIAESPEKLADYGLETPVTNLSATLVDGSGVSIKIGNKVTAGDGYYALVNDDKKVYLLADSFGSGLQFTDADMTEVAKDLTIEAANIKYISVDNRDGEDLEVKYDEKNTLDNSGSAMFPWVILKPYSQGYTADSSAISTLQQKYTTFDYIKCVEYNPSDLSRYGLEQPLSVISLGYQEARTEKLDKPEKNPDTGEEITEKTYYDPKEYQIKVGNLDESNNYYVMIDGDSSVYTIGKDAVDNMMEVDSFSLLNKFVAIPNIDLVDQIDVNIDGTTYTMNIERTNAKNDKGEDEVKTTYFYNRKEVEEEVFKDVYQNVIAARYDAPIKEEVNTEGVTPYLTMTFRLHDQNKTIITTSYLPYNDSFYIINNGETRFFADKRKIESIAKAVKEFKKTE